MADDLPDIEAARAAGYSDREILDAVGPTMGANVGAALKAGYTASDVLNALVPPKAPQEKPAPVPAPVAKEPEPERNFGASAIQMAKQKIAAIPGKAEEIYGNVVQGAATGSLAFQDKERREIAKQLEVLDRVDAGETIKPKAAEGFGKMADPDLVLANSYAGKSREAREAFRKELTDKLAAQPKPEDTLAGQVTAGIRKDIGEPIAKSGEKDVAAAESAYPLTEKEKADPYLQIAGGLMGLAPYVATGVLGGFAGVVGYGGVEAFAKTHAEALKAGASPEDAAIEGTLNGMATSALFTLPLGSVMGKLRLIPEVAKRPLLNGLVHMAESGTALTAFSQLQTLTDNALAKAYHDPNRDILEGVGNPQQAGVTFATGALIPPLGAAGALAGRVAGRAVERFRPKTPQEAAAPVLDAKTTDDAIVAAQRVVAEGTPVDIGEIMRSAEYQTMPELAKAGELSTPQKQARLLSLFEGMNPGSVEEAGSGTYHYRREVNGEEQTVPLKVWDPTAKLAEGETPNAVISPELAKAQQDAYGRMGVKIVYFENDSRIPFDGAVDPRQPDTIFLSNDPTRNVSQVAAHEIGHTLEDTKMPDGTRLADIYHGLIRENLTSEGWQRANELFGKTAPDRANFPDTREGQSAHGDAILTHLVTEIGAETMAELPKFQTFIPKVVEEVQARYGADVAKGVLAKLLDGIRAAMTRLREFYFRPEDMAEYSQPQVAAQRWLTNLEAIENIGAKMYAERFGTQAERESAALTKMREKVQRDRFLANFDRPAGEVPPPTAPEGFVAQRPPEVAGEPAEVPAAAIAPEAPRPPGPMSDPAAYAEAASRAATLRRWLSDLDEERRSAAPASPQAALLKQTEAAMLAKVNGVETRLTGAQRERLTAIRAQIDALHNPTGDSADMVKVRQALEVEQQRMADAAAIGSPAAPLRRITDTDPRITAPAQPEETGRIQAVMPEVTGEPANSGKPPAINEPSEPVPARPAAPPRAATPPIAEPAPVSVLQAKVRAEKERVWADKAVMGRSQRGLARNEQFATDVARERVMRQEAGPEIAEALDGGIPERAIPEIARMYRREDGETPVDAFHTAVDRWMAQEVAKAAHEFSEEGQHQIADGRELFGSLKSDPALEQMYAALDKHYADREEIPDAHEIPFGDETDRAGPSAGREAAPEAREEPEGDRVGGESGSGREVPGEARSVDEPASWVVKNKATGEILFETFDRKKVDALNTAKYEAVPILKHLQDYNRRVRENDGEEPKFSPKETEPRGPTLLDTREATADELAGRQRVRDKEEAEARMRGRKGGKTGQEAADDLPLFGGDRQKTLFSPRQTETPEFKRWFGKSVMTAENGPQIYYHGTDKDFRAFDLDKSGSGAGTEAERAIFVSGSPETASHYAHVLSADGESRGGSVYPVYVKAENPYISKERYYNSAKFAEQIRLAKALGHDSIVFPYVETAGERDAVAVFSPEQLKSVHNTGAFDPANPDIRMSPRITGENKTRAYTPEEQKAFENVGRTTEPFSLREWISDAKDDLGRRILRGAVDRYIGIKESDPEGYMALRLANSTAAAVSAFKDIGTLKFDGHAYNIADRNGGVTNHLLRPLGDEAHDFIWWVAANRADKLKGEDRENLFGDTDIAALKKLNQGTVDFDYTLSNGKTTRSREAVYLDSLSKLDTFNRNAMDLAVDAGLLDRKKVDALWSNPFYVPFYRQAAEGDQNFVGPSANSSFVKKNAFKTLKGGSEKLNNDLWENAFGNWQHMIDASLRNRAVTHVLDVASAPGSEAARQLTTQEANHLSDKEMKAKTVWIMKDGEKVNYLIEDPMLFKAVTVLDPLSDPAGLMTAGRWFKKVLQVGVTANPMFAVRNLIRDTEQTLAVSPSGVNVVKNIYTGFKMNDLPGALQNVARAVAARDLKTLGITDEAASAIAGGGLMRLNSGTDSGVSNVKLKEVLNTPEAVDGFWNYVKTVAHAYREAMGQSEDVNRLALYEKLRSEGVPHDAASFAARDLADFTLTGASPVVRAISQLVPFMNARFQGLYKVGRAAADADANVMGAVGAKVAIGMTKRIAYVMGAATVLGLALDQIYKDDEEYQKLTDYDRSTYYNFRFGKTWYHIPKGFEIAALSNIATDGIEAFFDKKMTAQRFFRDVWQNADSNLSMNPIPQAVRPIYDVATNTSGLGRHIESMGMENLQPEQRYTGRSTLAARGLSSTMNAGLRAIPGSSLSFSSPVQIDYMANAYGGWLATTALGLADKVVRSFTSEPSRPAGDFWADATQGMITTEPKASSRYVEMLYQQGTAIEQAYATYRNMISQGHAAEAQKFFQDNKAELQKHGVISGVMRLESNLNKQQRLIENSPTLSPEQKKLQIQAINAMKNRAAQQAFEGAAR